jgi:hypothetical protein
VALDRFSLAILDEHSGLSAGAQRDPGLHEQESRTRIVRVPIAGIVWGVTGA